MLRWISKAFAEAAKTKPEYVAIEDLDVRVGIHKRRTPAAHAFSCGSALNFLEIRQYS